MPKEGSVVKFKNFMKMEKVPYVVYSDFESVMDKNTGVHTACGFAVHLVNSMGKSLRFYQYRGEDTMDRFFEELDVKERTVDDIPVAEMIITLEQRVEFKKSTECYMCGKQYSFEDIVENLPVRGHDHISGLYRGSAHTKCNLRHRQTKKIKVIFHNLKGYDSHLITKAYRGKVEGEKVMGSIGCHCQHG